jgi:uncharacterized protein (TIGR00251 family)
MIAIQQHARGIVIPVRAHAGARRNAVLGERDGALRVAVTAAPEKGKANRAIADLLSRTFGVSKSEIELLSGDTSPQKRFLIIGARIEAIQQALDALC